jgi:hypothetical protein
VAGPWLPLCFANHVDRYLHRAYPWVSMRTFGCGRKVNQMTAGSVGWKVDFGKDCRAAGGLPPTSNYRDGDDGACASTIKLAALRCLLLLWQRARPNCAVEGEFGRQTPAAAASATINERRLLTALSANFISD